MSGRGWVFRLRKEGRCLRENMGHATQCASALADRQTTTPRQPLSLQEVTAAIGSTGGEVNYAIGIYTRAQRSYDAHIQRRHLLVERKRGYTTSESDITRAFQTILPSRPRCKAPMPRAGAERCVWLVRPRQALCPHSTM